MRFSEAEITFYTVERGGHLDLRRRIQDMILPDVPFPIHQVKVLYLTAEAVRLALAVGNHFHIPESGRWELFVVVSEEAGDVMRFRYRNSRGGAIEERVLATGEACLIPPGCSHAFVPLVPGVELWGFAPMAYNADHDVADKLF